MGATLDKARHAKAEAARIFSDFGKIVGVGIVKGDDGYILKINFAETPQTDNSLPSEVEGVPTRIEVIGPVRKY